MQRAFLVGLACVATGCQLVLGIEGASLLGPTPCTDAIECTDTLGGACVPAGGAKYCAYPDQTCGSGMRWDESAAPNLSATCTSEADAMTYRVGGTVNGLVGFGLQLETGNQVVTIDGPSASFEFPEGFATGDSFTVRIKAQPSSPAQGCRVVGATGTGVVDAMDFRGVVVNCGTDFSVGGSISGLRGTGLSLTTNGLTLAVSGDAFAFPPLPSGTSYVVTVKDQPLGPAQTCTVTSGTGTLVADDIDSVRITCATNRYAVGGRIDGLDPGQSVSLSFDGAPGQTVDANGPFTLGMGDSGAAFTVTVSQQPFGTKICSFLGGSGAGTVGDSDTATVRLRCVTSLPVPAGTFYRSFDFAADGAYPDNTNPATLSAFYLDRTEVTVGRFRQFVLDGRGTQAKPPAAGDGAHPRVPGSGWDPAWNANLPATTNDLVLSLKSLGGHTWTDAPGANEDFPINMVTWYDAQAFCAWEGGWLPTEAEFNYAAAGGGSTRAYPWSSPPSSLTIDSTYVMYNGDAMAPVGSRSPKGDALWGHADMAGSLFEWVLDMHGTFPNPCVDCANLTGTQRVIRSGTRFGGATYQRVGYRSSRLPDYRQYEVGFRCARRP